MVMSKLKFILLGLFIFRGMFAHAQTKDTVFVDFERLDPIEVSGSIDEENARKYQILKRRVK
jgi:hypothetical protein